MIERILNRLADRALGKNFGQLGLQPGVELVEDRPRSLLTQLVP